jgi:hypothetical protein
VTLEPYPTIPPRLNQLPWNEIRAATTANSQEGVGSGPWGFGSIQEGVGSRESVSLTARSENIWLLTDFDWFEAALLIIAISQTARARASGDGE